MDDVKRYSSYNVMMSMEDQKYIATPDGKWVAYEDYAALRARLEAVEKQREHAWSMVQKADNQVVQAAANSINSLARAERAEAALATARRDAPPALEEVAAITKELRQLGWMVPLSIVRAATDAAHAALIAQEDAQE